MPMILYDASLDGVSIHTLAEEIILRDIVENPASMDVKTVNRAMSPGMLETSRTRRKLEIDLVCVIYTQDSRRRAEIASMITAWANKGGWLTVNTRPGVGLRVRPGQTPGQGSSLRWQEDITISLTAYEIPYWEEEGLGATISFGTEWDDAVGMYVGSRVIRPNGNTGTVPVTCFAFNMAEATTPLTHLKIVVDHTMMEFEDMYIDGGGVLGGWFEIAYDENGLLNIRNIKSEDSSLMRYRTAESNDDLLARCNKDNQIHVYSDAMVNITFYAKGRWL